MCCRSRLFNWNIKTPTLRVLSDKWIKSKGEADTLFIQHFYQIKFTKCFTDRKYTGQLQIRVSYIIIVFQEKQHSLPDRVCSG